MKVASLSLFGRECQRPSADSELIRTDEVTMLYRTGSNEPCGVYVPFAIWWQVQAFVAKVIEGV